MSRYAVVVGTGARWSDLSERAHALGLALAAERPGLAILISKDVKFAARGNRFVIGALFDRATHKPFDTDAAEDLLGTGLSALLTDAWGSYIALQWSAQGTDVLRDPSAGLACFHLAGSVAHVIASGPTELQAFGDLAKEPLDERFVIHWLQYPYLRSSRTGLSSVSEILPGVRRSLRPASFADHLDWNPSDFARRPLPDDAASLADLLRSTVIGCVTAGIATDHAALQLSGGLDSSIIAACLAQASRRFDAVNFASRSADGDERRYATTVAEAFGAPLSFVTESEACIPEGRPLTLRPGPNLILDGVAGGVAQIAAQRSAWLLVDGGGGDSLFGSTSTAASLIDAFQAGHARSTLGDLSRVHAVSWWQVLRASVRPALQRRHPAWKQDRRFLRSDALLSTPDLHPWLATINGLPPGKREHLEGFIHIQHFLERNPPSIDIAHPLFVQPIIELCLQIPSWRWVEDGRDRAVARRAFADLVPDLILQRRTKGSLQGYFHRAFAALSLQLRHLLLDGELARMRVIDVPAVEQAFAANRWSEGDAHVRLSEMATLELWLRQWRSRT